MPFPDSNIAKCCSPTGSIFPKINIKSLLSKAGIVLGSSIETSVCVTTVDFGV